MFGREKIQRNTNSLISKHQYNDINLVETFCKKNFQKLFSELNDLNNKIYKSTHLINKLNINLSLFYNQKIEFLFLKKA